MAVEPDEIADGLLSVRVGHDGDDCLIALRGELDMSNVHTAEQQLEEALQDERGGAIVLDIRELEFIDSSGISALWMAQKRDTARRLHLIASESPAVTRVLEMTGITHLLSPDGDRSVD